MKRMNCFGYIAVVMVISLALTAEAATVRVTGGTLYLGNKLTATNFLLGSSATMSGNGEVRASATLSGTVSPGNSAADIGNLSFSDRVAFDSGSFVCYAATDTSLDRISVTGNVTGAATVYMTRSTSASPGRQIIIKGGAASDYTAFGVSPSSEWTLDEMNTLDLIVSFGQIPPAPQNLVASDGTYIDKVALSWSAASTATGYQVWRNTANNSSSATQIGTASQVSYDDTSAVVGTLYYYWVKATNICGASAFSSSDSGIRARSSFCADLDGDGIADLITVVGSSWYVWFSSSQYLVRGGPYDLGISGIPLTGEIDGDGLDDLISVVGSNWYVWFSTSQYLVRGGPYDLGISGIPLTGDIEGDELDDLIVVVGSNWYVWFSTSQYLVRGGPYDLGISGMPATGDIDGDGLADLISVVGSNWYAWFSTSQYLVRGGPYDLGISGMPATGDIDGDGLADLICVVGSNWYAWFSTSHYLVRGGPYTMTAP